MDAELARALATLEAEKEAALKGLDAQVGVGVCVGGGGGSRGRGGRGSLERRRNGRWTKLWSGCCSSSAWRQVVRFLPWSPHCASVWLPSPPVPAG